MQEVFLAGNTAAAMSNAGNSHASLLTRQASVRGQLECQCFQGQPLPERWAAKGICLAAPTCRASNEGRHSEAINQQAKLQLSLLTKYLAMLHATRGRPYMVTPWVTRVLVILSILGTKYSEQHSMFAWHQLEFNADK